MPTLRGATVTYLPQEPALDAGATVRENVEPAVKHVHDLLKEHDELKKIRIEGHTDNVGSAPYNKDLSERRAGTVLRYLADHGIPRERLESAGYGFERPVASNQTALGRAKNRRVEFRILGE